MEFKNLFDLTGRTALVAGAASGIGRAVSAGLSAFGARVICADINETGARETVDGIREHGGDAMSEHLDMCNVGSIRSVLGRTGRVHILVSTPSVNVRKPILQLSDEEFDRIVNLNLRGTFLLVRETARGMTEHGGGSIIVFSSIRSQTVEPGQGVYAATKSGVVLMLRALAAELGEKGVRANAIAPGIVETPLTAQIRNHPDWYRAYAEKNVFKRWAQPEELVGAVIYLASDASSYTTGSVMFVDGGWTAVDGRFTPPNG
ncbi:MAG: SDR family oxidoreductase [candidate division Zixibacteria bacterium]|nr:SDR family oxidoreductase [candidate division Zixibacteria bacterium]